MAAIIQQPGLAPGDLVISTDPLQAYDVSQYKVVGLEGKSC